MILCRHMHWGSYIIAFYFLNTLLLQASLHLIPKIEIPIYFCISKEAFNHPWCFVFHSPQTETQRPASADCSSFFYLQFGRRLRSFPNDS